jgi:hypothetical protein
MAGGGEASTTGRDVAGGGEVKKLRVEVRDLRVWGAMVAEVREDGWV